MEETTTIPLVSRRREGVQLFQKLQHALPSVVLVSNGIRGLPEAHDTLALAVAVAELVTGALVIGAMARSMRHARRSHDAHASSAHHGVDWVDVCLAAMLATEAWSHQHHTGHLPRPTVLMAVTMLLLGLLHGRIAAMHGRRRSLRASGEGITIGGRFFTRFTAPWDDLEAIDIGERYATISARGGRSKRLDLNDLRNRAAVTDSLRRLASRISHPASRIES